MKRVCLSSLVFLIVAFAAFAAPAPVRKAPPLKGILGGSLYLLTRTNAREELRLSADQCMKIEKLTSDYREALRGFRGLSAEERTKKVQELRQTNDEALAKLLTSQQFKRAEQIYLQLLGTLAFRREQLAAVLKLTDKQQEQMKVIRSKALEERRTLRQGGSTREQLLEVIKSRDEKILNVLTPAQKAKWKELIGEPFKVEFRRPE